MNSNVCPLVLVYFAFAFPCLARADLVTGFTVTQFAGSPDTSVLRPFEPSSGSPSSSLTISNEQTLAGLTCGSDGFLYSIDGFNDANSDRLFRIDALTGSGTVVGNTGFNWNFRSLDFNPVNGNLYAVNGNGSSNSGLYIVNSTTGAASLVANISGLPAGDFNLRTLAISPSGIAYATNSTTDGSHFIGTLNLTSGVFTNLGTFSVNSGSGSERDLAFGPNGNLFGLTSNGSIFGIDTSTFATTDLYNISTSGASVGLAFSTTAVPEPSSILLFSVATNACLLARRKRQRTENVA